VLLSVLWIVFGGKWHDSPVDIVHGGGVVAFLDFRSQM